MGGEHGKPGQGGRGGHGSRDVPIFGGAFLGADGPQGAKGTVPPNSAEDGHAGAAGQSTAAQFEWAEFEYVAPSGFIALLLREAELAYLREDYQRAVELFAWIAQVSLAGSPSVAPTPHCHFLISEFRTPQNQQLDDFGNRAQVYLAQIHLGQNYFGLPFNYVPLLRPKFYQDDAERFAAAVEMMPPNVRRFFQHEEPAAFHQPESVENKAERRLRESFGGWCG